MPFLNDKVMDSGLTVLDTDVENLYINNAEPATFTAASSTNKLGTKATPTVSAPADGTGGGRSVTISAITDGTVDSTGTASHWSVTDNSLSLLLATTSLASSQSVTATNTFTLDSIEIRIPDAA